MARPLRHRARLLDSGMIKSSLEASVSVNARECDAILTIAMRVEYLIEIMLIQALRWRRAQATLNGA